VSSWDEVVYPEERDSKGWSACPNITVISLDLQRNHGRSTQDQVVWLSMNMQAKQDFYILMG
jgi:hypothetical protein